MDVPGGALISIDGGGYMKRLILVALALILLVSTWDSYRFDAGD